ncbi:AbiTii domain-containing protein [Paenibacillus sp. FSL P4-0502]|uniref:AbiTii domain-containing protein n=1 Tax=Paenibacillus sp. FSL P4-0502 TaxID=2975319 RepID=UPI0030FB4FDD
MGRSKLLIDLVSNNTDLETILLRLKIILSDLGDQRIAGWIKGELEGYKTIEESEGFPSYRILTGYPEGTFVVNGSTRYRNQQVPLESLIESKETRENITTLYFRDNIRSIQYILSGDQRDNYAKPIPTAFCHSISRYDLQLLTMNVKVPSSQLEQIVSHVKSKLVEIIMELEKQFENLDDLDIRAQIEEDSTKKEQVSINIEKIIYEGSIEIGDNNHVKNSRIGKMFGRDR